MLVHPEQPGTAAAVVPPSCELSGTAAAAFIVLWFQSLIKTAGAIMSVPVEERRLGAALFLLERSSVRMVWREGREINYFA